MADEDLNPLDNEETSASSKEEKELQKLSTSMKGLRGNIRLALDEGESPKAIYTRLITEHGERYEKFFSRMVSGTPSAATENANKSLHQILIGMLFVFLLCVVFYQYRYFQTIEPTTIHFVGSGIFLVYFIFLMRQVLQFRGEVLYSLIITMGVAIYYFYGEMNNDFFESWMYGFFGLSIGIAGVAYYLKRQAFPNLKYGGPKKNTNGEYLF